jgi:hypothetical protein
MIVANAQDSGVLSRATGLGVCRNDGIFGVVEEDGIEVW